MSHRMQDAWAAFARTGDPSTAETGPWPRYAPDSRRTLRIGREVQVGARLREDQLAVWRDAYPWLLEPGLFGHARERARPAALEGSRAPGR
jgi:hypothetical protein